MKYDNTPLLVCIWSCPTSGPEQEHSHQIRCVCAFLCRVCFRGPGGASPLPWKSAFWYLIWGCPPWICICPLLKFPAKHLPPSRIKPWYIIRINITNCTMVVTFWPITFLHMKLINHSSNLYIQGLITTSGHTSRAVLLLRNCVAIVLHVCTMVRLKVNWNKWVE